jgi:hypothetical protein
LAEVALAAKAALDASAHDPSAPPVLVFDHATAEVIELDWRGTPEEVLARLQAQAPGTATASPGVAMQEDGGETGPSALPEPARGPGRPKLGVVAREVTLLPRHWEWLGSQPGGASVALRKLVEVARRSSEVKLTGCVRPVPWPTASCPPSPGTKPASRKPAARSSPATRPGLRRRLPPGPSMCRNHLKALATDAFWA